MKKIFTILCLMALTLGAQAGVVTTWTAGGLGNPVTKDNLVASAGTGAKYAFRMPSNTRPGWCNFVTAPVHINDVGNDAAYTTISTEHLFTIEAGSAEGKYKLKSFKNGTYLSGNAAFSATGMDLTLTNRIPKDNGNAVVGDYDTGFSEATPFVSFDNANGAHYNCGNPAGGLQFRGGTGGWSVYVAYGPFYVVNVKYLKADNTEMQAEETLIVTANTTITAPQHAGYTVDKESETITADRNITFTYTEAASFDYTFVVNNAPEGTTITIKGTEVSASASNVSFDAAVTESDVVVTFPTGYEHYSYTATISGTTITVNCKAMAAVTDLANLTDGYYVIYGRANNAGGYFYHDKTLANRFYRLSTSTTVDLDAAQYNNETNFKYVWILKNNGNGSFTLRNCGTFNYLPADQARGSNCTGTETANLVLDIANQWMYQTNYNNGEKILYLHVNQPGGDMNFSYWDDNGTPGGSGSLVAPVFYKVQLSDEAVAQIVANRKEDLSAVLTTLSSLPTGEGLNKYTVTEAGTNAITEASAVNNNENATLEEVDAAIELLENLGNAFTLNMPQDKTFLRIKSVVGDKAYLKAADAGATMTFSTTADASTIFCYIDGKLVAYQNGLAVNETNKMGTAGGAATTFTFKEGLNGAMSTYSLYDGDNRVLYSKGTNGSNADWYNTGDQRDNTTFTLEPVTELPITLRSTDNTNYFATFSAPVPVEISDAKLCSVSSNSNKWIQYTATENTQLAADHGVLLHATGSGETTIQATATILTETEATDTYGLEGYSAAFTVSDNTKLFLGRGSQSGNAGFYKLGSASTNGFKAYFANTSGESGEAKEGFDLVNANETTGVESIDNAQFAIDNAPVYNLQGQRVTKAQKGVFIQNGKKVVVK